MEKVAKTYKEMITEKKEDLTEASAAAEKAVAHELTGAFMGVPPRDFRQKGTAALDALDMQSGLMALDTKEYTALWMQTQKVIQQEVKKVYKAAMAAKKKKDSKDFPYDAAFGKKKR